MENNKPKVNFSALLLGVAWFVIVVAIAILLSVNKAEAASYTQDFDGMATNDSISTLTNWSVVADGGSCQARTTFAQSAPNSMSCIDDDAIFAIDTQLGTWSTLSVYYSWYLNAGTFYDTPTRFQNAGGTQDLNITYREDGAIYFFDNTTGDVCGGNETVEVAGFNADNAWADFRIDINKTANTFSFYDGAGNLLMQRSCTFVDTIEEWENSGHGTQQTYIDDFEAYSDGSAPLAPGTGTRVTELVLPVDGSTTASTTVSFEVEYISDIPVPAEICIAISGTYQTLTPICNPITLTGTLTFSTTTVLTTGEPYTWFAFLADEDGQVLDQSDLNWFSVVTPQMSVPDFEDPNAISTHLALLGYTSTTTASSSPLNPQGIYCVEADTFFSTENLVYELCNLAIFLFVPPNFTVTSFNATVDNFKVRFPASLFYNSYDAFHDGLAIASSTPFDMTLSLYGATTTIMSESIYEGILGEDTASNLRGLIGVFMWVLFAWGLIAQGSNWWAIVARGVNGLKSM